MMGRTSGNEGHEETAPLVVGEHLGCGLAAVARAAHGDVEVGAVEGGVAQRGADDELGV